MQEILLKIYGEVHGVNFRYRAREAADKLGLRGWVRNTADGSVGLLAQGERANLEKLLAWANRGPKFARVEKLEVTWREATEILQSFEIIN